MIRDQANLKKAGNDKMNLVRFGAAVADEEEVHH